ncbi:MAG: response regulator [Bdellovibrionaceae bacterium]|nr:response regulator [Bdellovibrio sp.]
MFTPNTRFLVVDDFNTMRKAIKKIFGEMGYTNIIEAADGQAAFETLQYQHAKGEAIDVIISDWNMPRMLGIDLLKLCKKTPEFKSLPFVLLTAESEQVQIIDAVKSGVSEYVIKPFSPQMLKEKLEKVYRKHNAATKVA